MPAVDLGEALGWKAGLWRLRKGGIGNEVVLRGLQSRDLNVLIDGQRVYGACPNHMDPAAFHLDFAEVDRVEVGKGPFDVKNQGALGGTVNVVTRKPEAGWSATPALAGGSFGFVNPAVTLGRGGERLSVLAGYSERRGDPFEDGGGRRFTELANYRPENQGDRAFSVGTAWGRVVWAPARGHQVDVAYTRQDSDAVLYPYLLMDALWDDTDRVNLRYEATGLGDRQASMRAQGYLTQVDHWMTDERRTSSTSKPRPYSMGTRAETHGGREGGSRPRGPDPGC
jgi:iron complex outermembrane receptor protein